MPGYQKFTLEDVVYKDGDTKEDTKKDTTVGNDFAHEWHICGLSWEIWDWIEVKYKYFEKTDKINVSWKGENDRKWARPKD